MTYSTGIEFEMKRAEKLVRKDHKQRWVYRGPNGATISETPVPFKEKISVYWLPIQQCVAFSHSPALLAHNALNSL